MRRESVCSKSNKQIAQIFLAVRDIMLCVQGVARSAARAPCEELHA